MIYLTYKKTYKSYAVQGLGWSKHICMREKYILRGKLSEWQRRSEVVNRRRGPAGRKKAEDFSPTMDRITRARHAAERPCFPAHNKLWRMARGHSSLPTNHCLCSLVTILTTMTISYTHALKASVLAHADSFTTLPT